MIKTITAAHINIRLRSVEGSSDQGIVYRRQLLVLAYTDISKILYLYEKI